MGYDPPQMTLSCGNRYDAFCKAVLRNEAKDYLHEMGRQRDRESQTCHMKALQILSNILLGFKPERLIGMGL